MGKKVEQFSSSLLNDSDVGIVLGMNKKIRVRLSKLILKKMNYRNVYFVILMIIGSSYLMSEKMVLCLLTYNRPEIINEFLMKEIDILYKLKVDLIFYDSSETEATKKL